MTIQIDLRRDLPKVRARRATLLKVIGQCHYSAPCAIGVMVSPRKRRRMDAMPWCAIVSLAIEGCIEMPPEQVDDAGSLQASFDSGLVERFDTELARLEAKYLTPETSND
jgi:hypothetical protein